MLKQQKLQSKSLSTLGFVVLAILLVIIFLLPPVKKWLNEIPYLFEVVYPLLALFSIYGLYQAYRSESGAFTLLKWVLLLVATGSSVLAVYGAGAFFFTLRQIGAVAFIVLEIGHTLVGGFPSEELAAS